jgi:hypothetical protein
MSHFNLNNSHPLIPNSNQYLFERKFVSINSEDRDISKYPNASEFEIELPQDYLNVQSVKLYSWSFPANYNVFSFDQQNVFMSFKIIYPYNPGEHLVSDPLLECIFEAFYYNPTYEFSFLIENGFYNPSQMATELTNKFNIAVTNFLFMVFNNPANYNIPDDGSGYAKYTNALSIFKTYDRFTHVYNTVGQKIWFGNNADQFVLTNTVAAQMKKMNFDYCINRNTLRNYSDYGLPGFLGLSKDDQQAFSVDEYIANGNKFANTFNADENVPRFYYGDVITLGDKGYWLLPTLPGATVFFLQPPFKINLMGPAYIFMEIDGLNCIDETIPYSNKFSKGYNVAELGPETGFVNGGVINSAFAKIPISTTPIAQWFDNGMEPFKYFSPPAERIRKLKIKFRYHDGSLIDFGIFPYSVMLEFNMLRHQQERQYNIKDSYHLVQLQEKRT